MKIKGIIKKTVILISIAACIFNFRSTALESRMNLTYLYAGTTSMYINYVDRAKESITVVCPDYFEIYPNGDLKLLSKIDTKLVDAMHARGIKVTPFLSNHWDRTLGRAALSNRVSLVNQIVSAVSQYGFDGVNIDIENLTQDDRNNYTDFIRRLRLALPPDKSLSIAVAANPYGVYYGWAGSYDYKALGELCDWILVMTYDESYYGGPEGPVASSSFVENSIKYALTQIPAEKLLLGLPFYGRYWKQGATVGGSGITAYDIESILSKYNGKMTYDNKTQTAKVVVTIKASDEKPKLWGGNTLGAGTYNIYYDNEQSLKYKLSLVQKNNLLGVGSWCLGQESLKTWDYFERWLNGKYFNDILGHYAQDDILALASKGWMIGVSSVSFAPNRTLTRAEAAIVMVRALGLENETPCQPYADTVNHYARDMIGIAKRYQIMLGVGNNRFEPNMPLTREQMAMILDRILVLPKPAGANPFKDISHEKNPLSYEAILRLASNDIVKGSTDGNFVPNGLVKRGEMAAFINRASSYSMTYPAIIDPTIDTPERIVEPR
ncbi:MAG: glycoside hydrolase [Clostridiaceae bacterium]|nr:glycoside hydrolase [Clostridiaceae bacterium]